MTWRGVVSDCSFPIVLLRNGRTSRLFFDDYVDARLESVDGLLGRLDRELGSPKLGWNYKSLWEKLRKKFGEASFSVRLQRMFDAVEVCDLSLTQEQMAILNFSNAARNCLLHSSGCWDGKGCRDARLREDKIGSRIEIRIPEFLACYDTVRYVLGSCGDSAPRITVPAIADSNHGPI